MDILWSEWPRAFIQHFKSNVTLDETRVQVTCPLAAHQLWNKLTSSLESFQVTFNTLHHKLARNNKTQKIILVTWDGLKAVEDSQWNRISYPPPKHVQLQCDQKRDRVMNLYLSLGEILFLLSATTWHLFGHPSSNWIVLIRWLIMR